MANRHAMVGAVALLLAISANPDPYVVFARARSRWAVQTYPRYLSYTVRISATDGKGGLTNTYQSFADTSTNTVRSHATSLEQLANPHVTHGIAVTTKATLSYRLHPRLSSGASVDVDDELKVSKTIPLTPREQVDVLGVPLLSPTYSFGLMPGSAATEEDPSGSEIPPLKTIAVVTASGGQYDIRYAGDADVDGSMCYHLILHPRIDPNRLRLRELWIERDTFLTRKALVQGNFTAGPSPGLAWTIHFATLGDRMYIADETSLQPLTYVGHTYGSVDLSFRDVQAEKKMDATWLLSTFSTSGDVLREP